MKTYFLNVQNPYLIELNDEMITEKIVNLFQTKHECFFFTKI